MTVTAETLKRIAALKLAPDAMQEVLSIIASCIEPLEQRRRRDRDRKRSMENPRKIHGNSLEIPMENPSPAYTTPPLSSKSKKISRSAVEVPELPSDKNLEDATSRGWSTDYAKSEWQRFRDWSINKGRKHRNVDAAWRNWVTSPYQINGSRPAKPPGRPLPDGIT